MLQRMGGKYARLAKAEGEEAAMRVFYRSLAPAFAHLSQAGDLRQAVRRRDQRRVRGRRIRAGALLPLPHRRRCRQGARRPAGDQGRPVPRRRRHAARRAADADPGRLANAVQGRTAHGPRRPRRWASSTTSRLLGEIVARAKDWVKANPNAKAPWDDAKFRPPSGKVFSPAGMMIWPPANAIYRRETYDNYPAAKAILSSVFEGLQLPMDLALAVESRYFAKILRSKEAAAMIRSLFVSMGELNKGARRPAEVAADEAAQDRRPRRRLHGRGRRLCRGERRARSGADRPRPGVGRQGQGAFGEARSPTRSPRAAPRAPTATRCSRASIRAPTTPI